MAKKLTEKYNDSCVKLFEFIKMLYEGEVEFKKVIDHFSNGEYDGTSNTHVTLNKYLNAMRIFGIKVKKINNKYHMFSSLYKIKLDLNDLKSIGLLKEACSILPAGKNKTNCEHFIHDLEVRYDEAAQSLEQIADNTKNLHLSFYHSEMVEQVKQCEKYCQDKLKLEIIFTNDKGEEINLLCSPIEQIYQKRKICLKVLGNNGSRVYEIPIENIKSVKQLPISTSSQSIPTTVVYRIKNRLARNYKLRDWERLDRIEADGSHIIVNKNEDLNLLIKRLMRYGTECEICSPKFLKEEMIERINKTLENYNET
ncbi:MAG TPA: WYL domain-containing protein [Candidatus Stercorousia faecigallinarum]|nr:WYL domain-containing protein [Candidatus Stercorousia faecigallinarum]